MQYDWTDFYTQFADKLLEFKNDRPVLINKLIKIYQNINMKLPTLDYEDIPVDIDPFTVYGLFNKNITQEHRKKIINGIIREFNLNTTVPEDFDGIPLLNNQAATFYKFSNDSRRGPDDINNLWNLFESALSLSENDTPQNREEFIKFFNQVINQYQIKWNITMGLFWIRPDFFINLDQRNRDYIKSLSEIDSQYYQFFNQGLKAEPYLNLRDLLVSKITGGSLPDKSFVELSDNAWLNRESEATLKASHMKWIKPIIMALRDLGGSGTPKEVREKIIENKHLSDDIIQEVRGKTKVKKFDNEVQFARYALVRSGYIDNSEYGKWTLTDLGWETEFTPKLVEKIIRVSRQDSNIKSPPEVETVNYWIYAPGPRASKWDEFREAGIMAIKWDLLGDLRQYNSRDEIEESLRNLENTDRTYKNDSKALWEFVHQIKPGDIIFARKGSSEIIGRGVVTSDYIYNQKRDEYTHTREVKWSAVGNWPIKDKLATKTLTNITNFPNTIDKINQVIEEDTEDTDITDEVVKDFPKYNLSDFLNEVYISENTYNSLVEALKYKKNIILQGAPGVGKTYLAKRLAYSMMGEKDIDRIKSVQFHQSYSYEDFIQGIRPNGNNFELVNGAFYEFCKEAENDEENDYFLIIDEINRGNLSKIFGELLSLLENDKRGNKSRMQLLYSNEYFTIPENVYVIGMMNTADRSLALIDYALRRRFAFFDLKPGFDSEGFKQYQNNLDDKRFDRLIETVKNLNEEIVLDETLGEGFCIGHSFFCNLTSKDLEESRLNTIVEYELIPLLKEYWFDEPEKITGWSEELRSAIR